MDDMYESRHTGAEIDESVERAKVGGEIDAILNAAEYSSAQTYTLGDYCTHDGKLYRCTTAITEAEVWTAEHWSETSVIAELIAIYSCLNGKPDASAVYTKTETDTLLQNNDPRRWGFGGNAVSIDSLDNAKETGVYKSGGIVCLSIAYSNGEVYQFRYTVSRHGFFEYQARYFLNSVWSPWEYINPRMEIGVEYRTTERYLGKPVYVKLVNCGALPNNGTKVVDAGIENFGTCVSCQGVASTIWSIPDDVVSVWGSSDGIHIKTTADYSIYNSMVTIKYTKATD